MKNPKYVSSILSILFVVACFQASALGQSAEDKNNLAVISGSGSSVKWDVAAPYSVLTMTVSAPDGRVFRKQFKGGTSPQFTLVDDKGERLPDGSYTYEIRLSPEFSLLAREKLKAARGKDDDAEAVRAARKPATLPDHALVQSGGFSILNGAVIVAGAVEEAGSPPVSKVTTQPRLTGAASAALMKLRRHHLSPLAMPDQVIPDDLIVQGSLCVGLDCVNNENFGFDTIRLKENNTRIQFDDTSTSAGFPTNNWQIRANASPSGGGSFLGIVDQGATGNSESGTIVVEVDAGAPANSLRVSNLGRIGLRTATPVLDVHANTNNTPAIRLEQNNSGGFTAQTWDMAGNEANFFIRDVTSGSTLPFRIRPGAPTSSLDISSNGNVGIATASPGSLLDVSGNIITVGSDPGTTGRSNNTLKLARVAMPPFASANLRFTFVAAATTSTANIVAVGGGVPGTAASTQIDFVTAATNNVDTGTIRMTVNSAGNVGIATSAPTDTLSVNGTASKPGGGTWAVFSDERLKNIKGDFNSGLKAIMALRPLRYEYKRNNALDINSPGEHVGFGAQAVQKVLPEAVTMSENGYLTLNSDPILWSMLNAIKEQQQQIAELKREVRQLRAASRKRR
jgi:hypothetical protein